MHAPTEQTAVARPWQWPFSSIPAHNYFPRPIETAINPCHTTNSAPSLIRGHRGKPQQQPANGHSRKPSSHGYRNFPPTQHHANPSGHRAGTRHQQAPRPDELRPALARKAQRQNTALAAHARQIPHPSQSRPASLQRDHRGHDSSLRPISRP